MNLNIPSSVLSHRRVYCIPLSNNLLERNHQWQLNQRGRLSYGNATDWREGTQLIDFLKQAFEAQETRRTAFPDGMIMNAEVKWPVVMVSEARVESHAKVRFTSCAWHRRDVQACASQATSLMEPEDQFFGDRNAGERRMR